MERDLAAWAAEPLDVLVVGGGIVGAASAREAARRGLRVGLVEAADFGGGTTAATTRLAHGGLRYLEQFDLAQVREGLRERQWLLGAAPHLVEPLPFLFPLAARRRWLGTKLRLGLWAYDRLAPPGLPGHAFVSAQEARAREPALRADVVARAAAFHDAQVLHPERLVLEFVRDAVIAGARVANHAPLEGLGRTSQGWEARVHDALDDSSHALTPRVVLNCAGPWVGRVAGLAGVERGLTRTTRGSHVAFPGFLREALILRATDGRTFFAVPWNEVTLVGTTDLDDDSDPGQAEASAEEVQYLLREAGAFMELPRTPCYTTCGQRAMVRRDGSPGSVPRGHEVLDHGRDGLPRFLSVVGGKLTTARVAARSAIDAVCAALGETRPPAAMPPLPGAQGFAAARARLDALPWPASLVRSAKLLGSAAPEALEGRVLCARHATAGMLAWSVEHEMCVGLADFLFRRSLAAHAPDVGAHCAPAMLDAMAGRMGWDAAAREAQWKAYEAEAARRRGGLPV